MIKKFKIMFVCHGNICRSPMAEFILKSRVARAGLEEQFQIASCATSREEIGNPVYPPAKAELAKHGISCDEKHAVQLQKSDYDNYDLFLCMDSWNITNVMLIFRQDPDHKLQRLLPDRDVADPWYTGRFDIAYQDIDAGCSALLKKLLK
ncbi:MAG: low molecular weight phosphotyrosine protein phosphatase [Oscillospiraceae bacterium]|nr:low molecular weight phosphotyrosine protein phosphatase [Oscillospiraceae bacterium]